jgi:hypothetical protein
LGVSRAREETASDGYVLSLFNGATIAETLSERKPMNKRRRFKAKRRRAVQYYTHLLSSKGYQVYTQQDIRQLLAVHARYNLTGSK